MKQPRRSARRRRWVVVVDESLSKCSMMGLLQGEKRAAYGATVDGKCDTNWVSIMMRGFLLLTQSGEAIGGFSNVPHGLLGRRLRLLL